MDANTLLPQTDVQRLQKEDFYDTVRPAEPRYGQTLVCRWNTSSDTDPSEQRYQPTSDDQTCRSKRDSQKQNVQSSLFELSLLLATKYTQYTNTKMT